MRILKFYRRPGRPEFAELVRTGPLGLLINHPLDKPYTKRTAEWLAPGEVWIDWCRVIAPAHESPPSP